MKYVGKGKLLKMGNKRLGVVCKDKTFRIYKKEKHKFRLFDGWGFNQELLKELTSIHIDKIEIHTKNRILKTTMSNIVQHAILYKNPKGEKDYQLILPETYFTITKKSRSLSEFK